MRAFCERKLCWESRIAWFRCSHAIVNKPIRLKTQNIHFKTEWIAALVSCSKSWTHFSTHFVIIYFAGFIFDLCRRMCAVWRMVRQKLRHILYLSFFSTPSMGFLETVQQLASSYFLLRSTIYRDSFFVHMSTLQVWWVACNRCLRSCTRIFGTMPPGKHSETWVIARTRVCVFVLKSIIQYLLFVLLKNMFFFLGHRPSR